MRCLVMIDLSKVPVGLDFTVKSKLKKSVKMAAIYGYVALIFRQI